MLGSREEAEDALQEVWVRLQGKLHRAREPIAYLWRTARNEARRGISRRSRRRAREVWEDSLELLPEERNPGLSAADRLSISRQLGRLPLKQREAITLMAFEGLSAREAGQRLGVSSNTVSSRYRLALERLKKRLAPIPERPTPERS